jgi:hypothetical protein
MTMLRHGLSSTHTTRRHRRWLNQRVRARDAKRLAQELPPTITLPPTHREAKAIARHEAMLLWIAEYRADRGTRHAGNRAARRQAWKAEVR